MKTTIIGFTGTAGAGKDTAASGLKYKQFAFAYPLKQGVRELFGFTDEQLYDPKLKEVPDPRWKLNGEQTSPRQILQWLGTDILRTHISTDFFLINMESKIKEAFENGEQGVCITDVRFDNEAEFVKSMGGIIIKIVRSGEGSGTKHTEHVTEKGISEHLVDYLIKNETSIEDLLTKVEDVVKLTQRL